MMTRCAMVPGLVFTWLGVIAPAAASLGQEGAPEAIGHFVTSEAGLGLASQPLPSFREGVADGPAITLFPDRTRQTIDGIGTSFTESSAFVLAHLDPERRRAVMERIYGSEGADFTLTRTHIGSCDFTVEGKYSYKSSPDAGFTIAPDSEGFPRDRYPGVRDEEYDLLPMVLEAQAIKAGQADPTLRIVASAWTAPPWMKDIGDWFIPGSEANNWQGTGGALKPEHRADYADYLVAYLDAYERAGVDIWGITPVNEPNGNGGHWESMHFSPESQNVFVRDFMGPALRAGGHGDVRLLVYDQNRDEMMPWADAIFGDPETAEYVYGMAIHWYSSTYEVFEDEIAAVLEKYPEFAIIHTEGCIDNLGNPAPNGIRDPEGFEESGWFQNDAFWWNMTATDWAYSAEWWPDSHRHPKYVPVHRYARNIIVSLDHGVTGWIDWNIVLDAEGGPNHANNFCGAPIMIDTDSGEVYYTPIFDVLAQFSRTIRPGDRGIDIEIDRAGVHADTLHACATLNDDGIVSVQVLNTTQEPIEYGLQIGRHTATIDIPANAVQTVQVQLSR